MNVFTITEENFAKEVLEADRPVLLDFGRHGAARARWYLR